MVYIEDLKDYHETDTEYQDWLDSIVAVEVDSSELDYYEDEYHCYLNKQTNFEYNY